MGEELWFTDHLWLLTGDKEIERLRDSFPNLSISQSLNLSISQSLNLSISQSLNLSIIPSVVVLLDMNRTNKGDNVGQLFIAQSGVATLGRHINFGGVERITDGPPGFDKGD